jgi:hypothetical protein
VPLEQWTSGLDAILILVNISTPATAIGTLLWKVYVAYYRGAPAAVVADNKDVEVASPIQAPNRNHYHNQNLMSHAVSQVVTENAPEEARPETQQLGLPQKMSTDSLKFVTPRGTSIGVGIEKLAEDGAGSVMLGTVAVGPVEDKLLYSDSPMSSNPVPDIPSNSESDEDDGHEEHDDQDHDHEQDSDIHAGQGGNGHFIGPGARYEIEVCSYRQYLL